MSIAFITNQAPPYRLPLFEMLAEELDCRFFFHGDHSVSEETLPFPAKVISSSRELKAAIEDGKFTAVITGLSGRSVLLSTYATTRKLNLPLILWASLWSHPKTPFHLLSLPLTAWLYRKADAVVTYGPHVTEYISRYRADRSSIFEATQAVDNAFFAQPVDAQQKLALREQLAVNSRPIVLFVGRLVAEKGVEALLEAWSHLERPNNELLLLAGQGPLAEKIEGKENVKAIGQISPQELRTLYSTAELLVLPSIKKRHFLEPWGLVVNEAMNQALPIVTTTAVGAAAGGLVVDQQNGLVISENDPLALAGALFDLMADRNGRQRLGQQGQRDVSSYSYERMLKAFKEAVELVGR